MYITAILVPYKMAASMRKIVYLLVWYMELGKGSILKVGLILMFSMSLILDGKLLNAPCS